MDLVHVFEHAPARLSVTIGLLVMDRSGSMARHDRVPLEAMNAYLRGLKDCEAADRVAVSIVTFADSMRIEVPLSPIASVPPLSDYAADGSTSLYSTLVDVMRPILEISRDARARGQTVNVVLAVFTDGMDNKSHPASLPELRDLAAQAGSEGWQLLTYGFGIDAKQIAKSMGFPADDATTVANTGQNVTQSVDNATYRTILTATGYSMDSWHDAPPSSSR